MKTRVCPIYFCSTYMIAAPNILNNIPENLPYCSFASFLIVLLIPLINEPDF